MTLPQGFNTIGGAVMGDKKRSTDTGRQGSLQVSSRFFKIMVFHLDLLSQVRRPVPHLQEDQVTVETFRWENNFDFRNILFHHLYLLIYRTALCFWPILSSSAAPSVSSPSLCPASVVLTIPLLFSSLSKASNRVNR